MNPLAARGSFRRNLALAFAAQGAAMLVNLLLSLVVARRLSVEDFSYWQLFTFYNSFVGLAALGLMEGVYLRCAGARYAELDKPLLSGQLRVLLLHSLLVGGAVAGFSAAFVADEKRRFVLYAVAVYVVLINTAGFLGCLFQAINHTAVYSGCVLLARLVFAGLALGLLAGGAQGFLPFLAAFLGAQALATLFSAVLARDIVFLKPAPLGQTAAELLQSCRAGLPLLLATVAGGLILGSGRLVVDGAFGIAAFGRFSFALALVNFLIQLIGQVGMVLFPALKARDAHRQRQAYRRLDGVLDTALPGILLAYAPLRFVLARWLPAYAESFSFLALLLPIFLFEGRMHLLGATYLKMYRREKTLLLINAACLGLSLGLSLLAAGVLHSMYGLALGLLAATSLRSMLAQRCVARMLGQPVGHAYLAHLSLAGIFAVSALFLPPLAGFLVYLAAYGVFLLCKKYAWGWPRTGRKK